MIDPNENTKVEEKEKKKDTPNRRRKERINSFGRRLRRLQDIGSVNSERKKEDESDEVTVQSTGGDLKRVLLVKTENLTHEPFEQTQEIKV